MTLTRTYSFFVPRLVCAVITVKATMMVTVLFLVANLPHLFGTCLAAITAIRDQANTWRTGRGSFRAFAGPLAVLGAIIGLRGHGLWGGQHLRRILGKCPVNLQDTSPNRFLFLTHLGFCISFPQVPSWLQTLWKMKRFYILTTWFSLGDTDKHLHLLLFISDV